MMEQKAWSAAEDEILLKERGNRIYGAFIRAAALLPGRTVQSCSMRWDRVLMFKTDTKVSTTDVLEVVPDRPSVGGTLQPDREATSQQGTYQGSDLTEQSAPAQIYTMTERTTHD